MPVIGTHLIPKNIGLNKINESNQTSSSLSKSSSEPESYGSSPVNGNVATQKSKSPSTIRI